jgi:hypothetical protein
MRNLREDWPEIRPRGHGGACSCHGCRARRADRYIDRLATQSLSTALRHAQDPWEDAWEAAPSASTDTVVVNPVKWSAAVTVDQINKNDQKVKQSRFDAVNQNRVYKITRDGKTLYVGGVWGASQSVAGRIKKHFKGSPGSDATISRSEERQIRKQIKEKPDSTYVQYADVKTPEGHLAGPKYTHAVELLLATKLKPAIYVRHVVTFEGEDDAYDL